MDTRALMIQGTMSTVGKSTIVAGLCRLFMQDGIRVMPFKAQNNEKTERRMTKEGVEISWAQAVQARAAGVEPCSLMNPIVINRITDEEVTVAIRGEYWDTVNEKQFQERKGELIPAIQESYEELKKQADLIIIEGSGSPAEINIRENDIVNMGMAEIADCPVILVADISIGGAFAQLLGNVEFMTPEERKRIKGFIVNKFHGDRSILENGLQILERKTQIPVLGIIPRMDVHLEEEDSLVEKRLEELYGDVDIAVIRFPKMTNASDLMPLDLEDQISVRYVTRPEDLQKADLILLPSTATPIADMNWLRESGLADQIVKLNTAGIPVMGICGGFQMLGEMIIDRHHTEGKDSMRGLGLLPMTTELMPEKTVKQVTGKVANLTGLWEPLSGKRIRGLEILLGESSSRRGNTFSIVDGKWSGACSDNVLGTYLHGIFEEDEFRRAFVTLFTQKRKVEKVESSVRAEQEKQYDILADSFRWNLDMDKIRKIINLG